MGRFEIFLSYKQKPNTDETENIGDGRIMVKYTTGYNHGNEKLRAFNTVVQVSLKYPNVPVYMEYDPKSYFSKHVKYGYWLNGEHKGEELPTWTPEAWYKVEQFDRRECVWSTRGYVTTSHFAQVFDSRSDNYRVYRVVNVTDDKDVVYRHEGKTIPTNEAEQIIKWAFEAKATREQWIVAENVQFQPYRWSRRLVDTDPVEEYVTYNTHDFGESRFHTTDVSNISRALEYVANSFMLASRVCTPAYKAKFERVESLIRQAMEVLNEGDK